MRFSAIRTTPVLVALTAALAAPVGAQAATASVDRACYPSDGSAVVNISGAGFTPGEQVTLQVGGGIIGVAPADPAGNVATTLPVPNPPTGGKSKNEKTYKVKLVQGANTATVSFRSTRTTSDFRPGFGRPDKLRVRFSAWGFGVATAAGKRMPRIYVHYVDPRRKLKRTVSLGRGKGPCGTITRTKLRKLFPFNPRRGTWRLQLDTSRKYRRATGVSRFLWDRITLKIG